MAESRHYDVFLSYSSRDRDWVSQFALALIDESIDVWFDAAALSPGDRWRELIQDALRKSRIFCIVVNAEGLKSPWTYFELGAAVADKKLIIPVLIDGLSPTLLPAPLAKFQALSAGAPKEAALRVAQISRRAREA